MCRTNFCKVCCASCVQFKKFKSNMETTNTIYVRGISKHASKVEIIDHFVVCGAITEVIFNEFDRKGYCWIIFQEHYSVDNACRLLHNSLLQNRVLSVRRELGKDGITNKYTVPSMPSTIRTARIHSERSSLKRNHIPRSVTYTTKSVIVDGIDYPTPQGFYLMKLLSLMSNLPTSQIAPLTKIILDDKHGNKSAKEISESISIANAILKLAQITNKDFEGMNKIAYVLGDGCTPFTSAVLALFMPSFRRIWSIDPLLHFDSDRLGDYRTQINLFPDYSQNFQFPNEHQTLTNTAHLSSEYDQLNPEAGCVHDVSEPHEPLVHIVIACHSHAPLQEFWDRTPSPKYCVSLPCCGRDWSTLNQPALAQYEDFEIFSPKRMIFLYSG